MHQYFQGTNTNYNSPYNCQSSVGDLVDPWGIVSVNLVTNTKQVQDARDIAAASPVFTRRPKEVRRWESI